MSANRAMLRLGVALVVAAMGVMPAAAQTVSSAGSLYKLDNGSTYQSGCFPPCDCPLSVKEPVQGTFVLTPVGVDPLFEHFDVTHVDWQIVPPTGSPIPVSGSGTFKIGGEVAVEEELVLELMIATESTQRFDSGLVAPNAVFPRLDLTISIHDMTCHDTVFHVIARPQPRLSVERDRISWDTDPPASTYDVVQGDLETLLGTEGDYLVATQACIASRVSSPPVMYSASPAPGGAFWFLLRDDDGSYDAWDAPLTGSRDAGIDESPASCP